MNFPSPRRPASASCLAAALLLSSPVPAFAYIDPGTGGMALQALLAVAAAAMVGLRSQWDRIKALLSRRHKHESHESHE